MSLGLTRKKKKQNSHYTHQIGVQEGKKNDPQWKERQRNEMKRAKKQNKTNAKSKKSKIFFIPNSWSFFVAFCSMLAHTVGFLWYIVIVCNCTLNHCALAILLLSFFFGCWCCCFGTVSVWCGFFCSSWIGDAPM